MTKQMRYSKQWETIVNSIRKNLWKIKEFPEYDFGNGHGRVTDGQKFVRSHLSIVNAQTGNPRYYPYLSRLRRYLKYCYENQKPS